MDSFYTFETWGSQLNDFCTSVVQDEAFFICNSIGGNFSPRVAAVYAFKHAFFYGLNDGVSFLFLFIF